VSSVTALKMGGHAAGCEHRRRGHSDDGTS